MDLSTTYLGLKMPHPFMAGASPLSATLDGVRRLEEAGSAAIVLPSLFEEASAARFIYLPEHDLSPHRGSIPLPALGLSPRDYLSHLGQVKKAVKIPVIASLNGTRPGRWTQYAADVEKEGADALELNLYTFAAEPWDPGHAAELRMLDLVRSLKASLRIPLAIKLSPFYTSLPHFATELGHAGAGALLLFNRFTPADIDLERLALVRTLELSRSSELLLRLRWLAVLFGRIDPALGVTGGVHSAEDAVKAILSGAQVVQVVSALLQLGMGHLETLRRNTQVWFERHRFNTLEEARGKMSLLRAPDPQASERMNYIYNLDSWYSSNPYPIDGHPTATVQERSGT